MLAAVAVPLGIGCGSPDAARPPLVDGGGLGPGVSTGPCEEGIERECGYKLDQANGVVTCYEGVQVCDGGEWSECTDGEVVRRPDLGSREMQGFLRAQALSSPIDCANQPCDPYCKLYDENPDPDVTPPGGSSTPDLPDFPGGPGVQACAHDLCTTGAALYNTCHACVQAVCAVSPGCCTTAWTQACVDQVYYQCTTNQRPPLSLCEFGLYSDTSVSVANRATSDALIGADGNVTFATEAQFGGLRSTGNVTFGNLNQPLIAPQGIIANGYVDAQDANYAATTYIEAGGDVAIRSWDVSGAVRTAGNLTGQNSTTILGGAWVNGSISSVSSITPTTCQGAGCYTHRPVVLPPKTAGTAIPTLPTNCTGTTNYSVSGGTTTITPGVYGNVNIFNNGRLVLDGEGVYYFNSFQVWDRIEFRRTATNTGAGWDLRVCGTTSLGNGTLFVGSTAGGVMPAVVVDGTNGVVMDPSLITVFTSVAGTVNIGTNVYMTGVFMAPNAHVVKADVGGGPTRAQVLAGTRAAPINGAIWARQLTTGTDSQTKQISREACEATVPEAILPPATCPITNVTPNIPPALNEPCRSGLDCQINHRCVEPQTGATCSHSKCMPGVALSASCDSCVARICATDPTCCSTSWTQGCVDRVATVCDARCGTYSCYFGDLCSANASVPDRTCNTCVNSICAADPSCCNTAWTQACADRVYTLCGSGLPNAPTTGTSMCDYAAYSNGSVAIQGANIGQNAVIRGGSVGGSGLGSMNLSYTSIEGNAYNAGSFYTSYATITGNLIYGSGASNSFNAPTSYSALIGPSNPPQPPRPTRSFTCPGGATPTSGTIAPGNYGNVSVPNGSTLTLQAGTYNFSSLTIGAGGATSTNYGTLALPASGRVTINVCGNVTFNSFARMSGVSAANAMNIDVYATGSISFSGAGAVGYGVMNANSSVALNSGAILYGFAWAGTGISVLGNGTTIDSRTLAASCRTNFDPNFSTRRIDRLCGYSAYSKTTANVTGTTVSGGDLGAGTTVTVADTSRFFTNVLAQGAVTKGTTSSYYQSIRSRSTISGSATVLGTESPSASAAAVPVPTWPTVAFSCTAGRPPGGTDQNLWGATLAPGTYGHVSMAGEWQTLTLQAGDYYVGNLDLTRANTTLTLPASGTVRIFACGTVNFGNGLITVNNPVSGASAGRFRVYSLSTANADAAPAIYVNRGSGHSMGGVFVAPNGKISVGASSTLSGVAWADSFFAANGAILNAESFAGSTCEALSVDTAASCPEVMTSTPPSETGDCQSNVLGYTDGTCPTYDLALDIPCGDEIPVCNHGTSSFLGDVTLGYYASSRGQMSLATPSAPPDGTCTATGLTIAAGNCVDVTCVIPSGATYTVMLDPGNTLSECGSGALNRRLDNWTVDDDQTCMSGGPLTVTYDYEAICPTGTIGKWGTLTWNTTTPGSSNIVFSARTADTSGGLAAAPWVPVSVAQASPTDTQVCPISAAPGACYRDLTNVLNLGMVNQPQFLELRMEVTPSGADLPILRDWKVTYSCAFDQ